MNRWINTVSLAESMIFEMSEEEFIDRIMISESYNSLDMYKQNEVMQAALEAWWELQYALDESLGSDIADGIGKTYQQTGGALDKASNFIKSKVKSDVKNRIHEKNYQDMEKKGYNTDSPDVQKEIDRRTKKDQRGHAEKIANFVANPDKAVMRRMKKKGYDEKEIKDPNSRASKVYQRYNKLYHKEYNKTINGMKKSAAIGAAFPVPGSNEVIHGGQLLAGTTRGALKYIQKKSKSKNNKKKKAFKEGYYDALVFLGI